MSPKHTDKLLMADQFQRKLIIAVRELLLAGKSVRMGGLGVLQVIHQEPREVERPDGSVVLTPPANVIRFMHDPTLVMADENPLVKRLVRELDYSVEEVRHSLRAFTSKISKNTERGKVQVHGLGVFEKKNTKVLYEPIQELATQANLVYEGLKEIQLVSPVRKAVKKPETTEIPAPPLSEVDDEELISIVESPDVEQTDDADDFYDPKVRDEIKDEEPTKPVQPEKPKKQKEDFDPFEEIEHDVYFTSFERDEKDASQHLDNKTSGESEKESLFEDEKPKEPKVPEFGESKPDDTAETEKKEPEPDNRLKTIDEIRRESTDFYFGEPKQEQRKSPAKPEKPEKSKIDPKEDPESEDQVFSNFSGGGFSAKQKEDEDALKLKAEEEFRRKREEELRRKEEELRRKEEELRRKEEEERRRRIEEELRRREEEIRKKEEELQRKAEEERKQREEEQKLREAEEQRKREEAARLKKEAELKAQKDQAYMPPRQKEPSGTENPQAKGNFKVDRAEEQAAKRRAEAEALLGPAGNTSHFDDDIINSVKPNFSIPRGDKGLGVAVSLAGVILFGLLIYLVYSFFPHEEPDLVAFRSSGGDTTQVQIDEETGLPESLSDAERERNQRNIGARDTARQGSGSALEQANMSYDDILMELHRNNMGKLFGLFGEMNENLDPSYGIVLYSSASRREADDAASEFKNREWRTHIMPQRRSDGSRVWRVVVGQFSTHEEANREAKLLPPQYRNDFLVTQFGFEE